MKYFAASLVVSSLFAMPALAQSSASAKPRAVLELYTSQGCSSCPPADRLFGDLAKDSSLIILTLPVDYWDYLGWKDTLGHPSFSYRQKAYAAMRSDRQVYTPQAVINGVAHAVGSQRNSIEAEIIKTRDHSGTLSVDVAVEKVGSDFRVKISGSSLAGASGHVWVMPIVRTREVQIGRGENTGRTVSYVNVVRRVTNVGAWKGEAMTMDIPASSMTPDAEGVVVLLQSGTDKKSSQVLGAGRLMGL
ncbi:MAG: DUF1223 domain-containing protein [Beijerinckiaceae bacterium]